MLKGVPGPPPIQSNPDSGKEASKGVGHERNFKGDLDWGRSGWQGEPHELYIILNEYLPHLLGVGHFIFCTILCPVGIYPSFC